jgi:hypothetical protein
MTWAWIKLCAWLVCACDECGSVRDGKEMKRNGADVAGVPGHCGQSG